MTPAVLTLYRRFRGMIAACGPFHVGPAKTRIAFLGEVRFAGVAGITKTGLTVSFALPGPLRSKRFRSVSEVAPGWWAHRLVVRDPAQLDAELQGWLRRSYRLMGMRGRLAKRAAGRAAKLKGVRPASRSLAR
jgi:hypothetical protein